MSTMCIRCKSRRFYCTLSWFPIFFRRQVKKKCFGYFSGSSGISGKISDAMLWSQAKIKEKKRRKKCIIEVVVWLLVCYILWYHDGSMDSQLLEDWQIGKMNERWVCFFFFQTARAPFLSFFRIGIIIIIICCKKKRDR